MSPHRLSEEIDIDETCFREVDGDEGVVKEKPAAREIQSKSENQGKTTKKERAWTLGEKFNQRMPHHDGNEALWETKWKMPCMNSVYPFHDGKYEDFEGVFEYLVEHNISDPSNPVYTKAFFHRAEELTSRAKCLVSSNPSQASELYLRAACLYRIARFPYTTRFVHGISGQGCRIDPKWQAWLRQKEVYLSAASLWKDPVREVVIPLPSKWCKDTGKTQSTEEEDAIPVYIRLPSSKSQKQNQHPLSSPTKYPIVILLTGLDGYRPDNTTRLDEFTSRGWASLVIEIPGTADCSIDPSSPTAGDELSTIILDWAAAQGVYDMERVMVWGLSAGGYHAVRMAHTHASHLRGVVAQGAGVHWFFDRGWSARSEGREYPFELAPHLATKHGYATVDEYRNDSQGKWSLLENGILDMPSTRLLLVNGTHDGLMPIEDSMLLFEHGSPKEARFFSEALHMGYPLANASVYPWMESVMR